MSKILQSAMRTLLHSAALRVAEREHTESSGHLAGLRRCPHASGFGDLMLSRFDELAYTVVEYSLTESVLPLHKRQVD